MPRMSKAEKQKSHKGILDAASHLFRENGIEATSVSDVMKAAGLTHGGFYRHFDSKRALVSAAFNEAVDQVLAEVENAAPGPQRRTAQAGYVDRYLSEDHIDDRGNGCPLAALATEMARKDGPERDAAWEAVGRMAGALDMDTSQSTDQGIARMAMLLGAITLARLAGSGRETRAILEAGRTGEQVLAQHWSS